MQPQNNPQSGFNLPPAPPEQLPPVMPFEVPANAPEIAPIAAEQAPAPGPVGAIQMPVLQPPVMPTTASGAVPADVSSTTSSVVPNATEDTDLIEKEWVSKAKQIVERTREDPYQQSKELTVLKADYMQKRYNKTIKLSE